MKKYILVTLIHSLLSKRRTVAHVQAAYRGQKERGRLRKVFEERGCLERYERAQEVGRQVGKTLSEEAREERSILLNINYRINVLLSQECAFVKFDYCEGLAI